MTFCPSHTDFSLSLSFFPEVCTTFLCRRAEWACALESTTIRAASVSWLSCTIRREPPQSSPRRRAPCGAWWVPQSTAVGNKEENLNWILKKRSRLVLRIEPLFTDWLLEITRRRGGCTKPSSSVFLFWSLLRFVSTTVKEKIGHYCI